MYNMMNNCITFLCNIDVYYIYICIYLHIYVDGVIERVLTEEEKLQLVKHPYNGITTSSTNKLKKLLGK